MEHSVVLWPDASITREHRRCNYITISITVAVPINNMHALRYVIVMMRAAKGSRLVRQLLHTGHYTAPPKNGT